MSTPRLPVPPLTETTERYLKWVSPLLDETQFAHTQELVTQFNQQDGVSLQADLEQFAAKHNDSSWLIDAWLESYLACRGPLPLVSNVGFTIEHQQKVDGYAGIARWLAAATAVHVDYLDNGIAAAVTPQGNPVCMRQWQILQGGIREAAAECDRYEFADANAANRHIGIWHNGYYYRLPATNAAGQAYDAEAFQVALEQIGAHTAVNPYPVATPAFLGSEQWADISQQLAQTLANAELLTHMSADLFHLSLHSRSGMSADDDLRDGTFNSESEFWPYKPITYRFNLATNYLILHCEHTWPDGGMIKGLVNLIQQQLDAPTHTATEILPIDRYEWALNSALQQNWPRWQQQYAEQADIMRVRSTETALAHAIPKGFSQDALIQFALQYAQLHTYGSIRNTYEAVDVSHFQSGRTECIRPVSSESVALINALASNHANSSQLQAALAEHKNRVKACKTGHGVNRHLLGLKLMADRAEQSPELFADPAYAIITTDFLTTSTLGDGAAIRNFAFAPTSANGLGVNYTILPQSWLLTLSYTALQHADAQRFQVAFAEAAGKLLDLSLQAAA